VEQSYTPLLTASTTPPTLGTGSVQLGRFWQHPITGMVVCHITIRFGTSGTNAGSGTYLIELPTAVDMLAAAPALFGVSDVIGHGLIRDNNVPTGRQVTCTVNDTAGGTGGVGRVFMSVFDGTAGNVTQASPWAWAAEDGFALVMHYLGVLP
jgi:hypothetical protein